MKNSAYDQFNLYYGDLHSHSGISYGHGTAEEAYQNGRLQLDFTSVTAHAHWPDMPVNEPRLMPEVEYHKKGFEKAEANWKKFLEVTESFHQPGRFVTFPSFEMHSMAYGDHNVYFKESYGHIIRALDLEDMRSHIRQLAAQGIQAYLVPHHIGYKTGYRGINWNAFTSELSPVVEMFSMHGCAEGDDAPLPYLHTMGPRDGKSVFQYGLETGQIFGIIGSTDHHSAHPGSYGNGRLAIWATELTRDGIWKALAARRTIALTGDRIELGFSINQQPVGSILPAATERQVEISVKGGDTLDCVELFYNNHSIQRWHCPEQIDPDWSQPVKVAFEVGWGRKGERVDWSGEMAVNGGRLISVEPHFRGRDIVAPAAEGEQSHAFSSLERVGADTLQFTSRTWGNPATTTPGTQGFCLEIQGGPATRLQGRINGVEIQAVLGDLVHYPQVNYLGGFLTPACCFHRVVPLAEYSGEFAFKHSVVSDQRDWYYVRVRQKNGQCSWSSPIWVG